MGRPTREKEGTFRLICARNGIAALMGLFQSMAIRSAVPSIFSAAAFSAARPTSRIECSRVSRETERVPCQIPFLRKTSWT